MGVPRRCRRGLAAAAMSRSRLLDPVLRRGLGWALKTSDREFVRRRCRAATFGHRGLPARASGPIRSAISRGLPDQRRPFRPPRSAPRARRVLRRGGRGVRVIAIGLISGTRSTASTPSRRDLAARPGYAIETLADGTLPFPPSSARPHRGRYPPARSTRSRSPRCTPTSAGVRAGRVGGRRDGGRLVASHGLTLAHDGDAHHTLQIGDRFAFARRPDAP